MICSRIGWPFVGAGVLLTYTVNPYFTPFVTGNVTLFELHHGPNPKALVETQADELYGGGYPDASVSVPCVVLVGGVIQ